MPKQKDEALSEAAEEAVVEEPTTEEVAVEGEPEPEAGGEPGVEPEPEEAEEPTYGPIPYARFQEVVEERNREREKAAQYEQLYQHPEVAEAIRRLTTGARVSPTPTEPSDLTALPEGLTDADLSEEGRTLYGMLRQLEQKQSAIERNVQAYTAYQQQKLAEEAGNQFMSVIAEVKQEVGRDLTEAEQQSIYDETLVIIHGNQSVGKPITVADAARRAYKVVRDTIASPSEAARLARERALTAEKRKLSGARPGNVPGPATETEFATGLSDTEIANRVYAKVKAEHPELP